MENLLASPVITKHGSSISVLSPAGQCWSQGLADTAICQGIRGLRGTPLWPAWGLKPDNGPLFLNQQELIQDCRLQETGSVSARSWQSLG